MLPPSFRACSVCFLVWLCMDCCRRWLFVGTSCERTVDGEKPDDQLVDTESAYGEETHKRRKIRLICWMVSSAKQQRRGVYGGILCLSLVIRCHKSSERPNRHGQWIGAPLSSSTNKEGKRMASQWSFEESMEQSVTSGFCTTLSYVASTDSESMIGDVMRTQRTPRLTPAACSLTRCSYLLRAANI